MKSRFLFDFDGVLMDSVRELAVTTFNAISGHQISELDGLPKNYLERFRANRSFGHEPYEMVLIGRFTLESLDGPSTVISPLDQEQLRAKYTDKAKITKDFFECRASLVEKAPERWAALNQPFEPIWSALQKQLSHELVIVTTKNRVAVLDLCRHYNLSVEASDVYAGDALVSKSAHFLTLAQRFPGERLEFLEDSLQNLRNLKSELPDGICPELLVARWGYLSADQLLQAEEEGFRTFEQADFIRHAFLTSAP